MSRAIHCDLPGCDAWADASFARINRVGWIRVTEDGERVGDYCCGAHAWQDLARRFEPPTVIPT